MAFLWKYVFLVFVITFAFVKAESDEYSVEEEDLTDYEICKAALKNESLDAIIDCVANYPGSLTAQGMKACTKYNMDLVDFLPKMVCRHIDEQYEFAMCSLGFLREAYEGKDFVKVDDEELAMRECLDNVTG